MKCYVGPQNWTVFCNDLGNGKWRMDLWEIGWEGVKWIHLARDMECGMKHWIP